MQTLWAATALTPDGWQDGVAVDVATDGRIAAVRAGAEPQGMQVDILLPAPVNLHSHAFQRAMAGLSERRAVASGDSFWSWRTLMYRFLEQLAPDDVEAIAALVHIEMLEAGYAAVGEFHYLHNAPGGVPYDAPSEMAGRIVAAAECTGIGLTMLPVLYRRGGCDGRPLSGGQLRFGTDRDGFAALMEGASGAVAGLPDDAALGVAPHSLRAVSADDLAWVIGLLPGAPVHLHIAEQTAEVADVEAAYGARPVTWLANEIDLGPRFCLIHATHMSPEETETLARSCAVAGLCPITESNLGDGIFDGARFLSAGGAIGIGSDSNIRISLSEELRTLEYSQRLRDRARVVLADDEGSVGRRLYEAVCAGGAQAAGRACGAIATGNWADLVALDGAALLMEGAAGDQILDLWLFAGDDRLVREVWSAGRHVVRQGVHRDRAIVEAQYRHVMRRLRDRL